MRGRCSGVSFLDAAVGFLRCYICQLQNMLLPPIRDALAPRRHGASASENAPDSFQSYREALRIKGIPVDAVEIIIFCWRDVTGCLKLLASTALVAYSIAKIVMGSKYKSACPVEPLVPVFVILSGCVSFLLFAFTCQHPNRDQPDDIRATFRRKCCFTICCIGATLNTAVLITGTVIVSQILHRVKFSNSPCYLQQTTSVPGGHLYNISQPSNISYASVTNSTLPSITTTPPHMLPTMTSNLTRSMNETKKENVYVSDSESGAGNGLCDHCVDMILIFAAVSVGVDWFLAIFGSVILCFRCFHSSCNRKESVI